MTSLTVGEGAIDRRSVARGPLRPLAGYAVAGQGDPITDARTALLAEELELRRHLERVAEQRRALPLAPLWNFLDMTPEGRGGDGYPSLEYGK